MAPFAWLVTRVKSSSPAPSDSFARCARRTARAREALPPAEGSQSAAARRGTPGLAPSPNWTRPTCRACATALPMNATLVPPSTLVVGPYTGGRRPPITSDRFTVKPMTLPLTNEYDRETDPRPRPSGSNSRLMNLAASSRGSWSVVAAVLGSSRLLDGPRRPLPAARPEAGAARRSAIDPGNRARVPTNEEQAGGIGKATVPG